MNDQELRAKAFLLNPSNKDLLSPIWQKRIEKSDFDRAIAIHWLIKKKYNDRHKIPCKRTEAKHYEALGDWFLAILNLSEAIHNIPSPTKNTYNIDQYIHQYPDSWSWFVAIMNEIKIDDYQYILEIKKTDTKSTLRTKARKEIESLKNFENPCDTKIVALWQLIECGRIIARDNSNKKFRQNYWTGRRFKTKTLDNHEGFISAYSKWLASILTSDWNQLIVDGDRLSVVKRKGSLYPYWM